MHKAQADHPYSLGSGHDDGKVLAAPFSSEAANQSLVDAEQFVKMGAIEDWGVGKGTMSSAFQRSPKRRVARGVILSAFAIFVLYFLRHTLFLSSSVQYKYIPVPTRPERYPVTNTLRLPRGRPKKIPKIQHVFAPETRAGKAVRVQRLDEVRNAFLHAWNGYKKEAWMKDELKPVTGGFKSPFCGWAATLVDSLDTLWIMGLHQEFELALQDLKKIDFTNTEGCQINLFETTIRHLGGLLAAFDISGGKHFILVEKAVELGEILYTAFDTPNRMPSPHYVWSATNPNAHDHVPSRSVVLAVLGSLTLEFTRLAQITGNDKYYDAVQRIMNELEKWQDHTSLPGMWPATVDSTIYNQSIALGSPYYGGEELFTLAALADSMYEYLPKSFLILGGRVKQYRKMYEKFVDVAKTYLFFRPMNIGDHDILISGSVNAAAGSVPRLQPEQQHLTCFTGGMLAIAGKIFNRPDDVDAGRKLADGCVWSYKNTMTGIMPETFTLVPCANRTSCPWDSQKWWDAIEPGTTSHETIAERVKAGKLSPGFVYIQDGRYLLRPEAIESVFILYRVTGEQYWTDSGWDMFKSIMAHTTTELAHSAIDDVTSAAPKHVDEMESFWLAETLKYFYLLYSEPNVVSLDEYVLNTEAHPLKRPV